MGNSFGRYFVVTTFGESHGAAIGAVIDGVPAGILITREQIQLDLDRRKPAMFTFASQRAEPDIVEILSGIYDSKTNGAPVALLIRNKDANSADYSEIAEKFRPGHSDYTYWKKYGVPPQPGGGRLSGRETAARVAAGAIARALIGKEEMKVIAYTIGIGKIFTKRRDLAKIEKNPVRCPDETAAMKMLEAIKSAQERGDSIGGVIEIIAHGVPAGLGMPVFDKLNAMLAHALLSIGAVKGIEFGEGFNSAQLFGSQMNDALSNDGFLSNHSGGIIGGISSGQDIIMRIAVKPAPSIAISQKTVTVDGNETKILVKGRHDVCLCPRICSVAEAMTAIVLADAVLEQRIQR